MEAGQTVALAYSRTRRRFVLGSNCEAVQTGEWERSPQGSPRAVFLQPYTTLGTSDGVGAVGGDGPKDPPPCLLVPL